MGSMDVKNEQQLNTNEDDLSKGTASALEKTNEIFKSKDEIISSDPKKEEIENIRAGALGLKDVMNQKKESLKDDKKENSEFSAVSVDKSKDCEETEKKEDKDNSSKENEIEIEEIGEILDIKEDQIEGSATDSFINENDTSLGKQNSSQIDEKSSIEKDIDEGSAEEEPIKKNHTSSEKEDSSQIDEELSVEKEGTGDKAPDSFINDIYTSKGKQSVPETDVSDFKSGSLQIIVHKAAELVNKDRLGKSDPYVIVKYRDKGFRSKTINNTLEPIWDFMSEFDIVEIDDSPIDIEVYDDDYGKDSSQGFYSLTLDEAINDLVVEGKWYNLEGCKTGKVFISAIYAPKDDDIEDAKQLGGKSDPEVNNQLKNEPKEDGLMNDNKATLETSDSSGLDVPEVKDMFTLLQQIPHTHEKEAIKIEDKKEFKEESGSSGKNDELENSSKEDETVDDKKETLESSLKSETSMLNAPVVKDMFSILKQIPHVNEEEADTDNIGEGVLSLIIHKASQLENLDTVGKSDPFVKIRFNEIEFKSKTVSNSLEPEWNFSNDFVVSKDQKGSIDITVYDSDVGKDDIEGSYSLPLQEAIKNSHKEGAWYNLNGSKNGKLLISSKFVKNELPSVGDDVDGPSVMNEEFCDNDPVINKSSSQEKGGENSQNKMEIQSIKKEGENGDYNVDIDEDTDKQDDDVSESDYSYVTVADLSRKEDISQSEADDQNKIQKDKDTKTNDDKNELTMEDESVSKEASKGFMASIKDTVGGFFYSEKAPKEDKKEEEPISNDLVDSEKESDKLDALVPREFLMQPTSQDGNISSSSLTKKQPINLKDENETIMEETEPIEVTTEKEPAIVKMVTCHSETAKEYPTTENENKASSAQDDLVENRTIVEPAEVEMITCHSESSNNDMAQTPTAKDTERTASSVNEEDAAVVKMITCHSEERKETAEKYPTTENKNKTSSVQDDLGKNTTIEEPAVVEIITCHSESSNSDMAQTPTAKDTDRKASSVNEEDAAVVQIITCHSEETKENKKDENIKPTSVELVTCHAESPNLRIEDNSSATSNIEA